MSKRNPGGLISTTGLREPSAIDQSQNSGVWTLEEQYKAGANGTWANQSGQTYQIANSLRFRRSAGAYLIKTLSSAGNRKTWTLSVWVKISNVTNELGILGAGYSDGAEDTIFISSQRLRIRFASGSDNTPTLRLRDPSAWYHVMLAIDTTKTAPAERLRWYLNGKEVGVLIEGYFSDHNAFPSQNHEFRINNAQDQLIGRFPRTGDGFDGYMSEYHFIDGQQLTPDYFGYFDYNGIWQPKPYTGSYGNNGVYLPFYPGSNVNLADNYANSSNYALQSESFDSGTWQKPAAPVAPTVTANSIANPFSSATTADTLNFSTTNTHPVYQTVSLTVPRDLGVVTGSVYLKQNTANQPIAFQVALFNSGAVVLDGYGIFTFTSTEPKISNLGGSAGSHINARYENVGNGWYRVIVTVKNTTVTTSNEVRISVGQYGQAGSVYAWGAMLNYGYQPGEYRVTTTSAINNNWTPTNISADDCMKDSPTNGSAAEDTGLGGQVAGNYATWNSLAKLKSSGATDSLVLSNGNLTVTAQGSEGYDNNTAVATLQIPSTGKWYWEVTTVTVPTLAASRGGVGIMNGAAVLGTTGGNFHYTQSGKAYAYVANGQKAESYGVFTNYGTSFGNGVVIGVAFDVDAGTLVFYRNGVSQGTAFTGITSSDGFFPTIGYWISATVNFGQRPFAYAAPAGFKCLNTANLPQPAIPDGKDYFNTVLYSGNNSIQTINVGFQPDFVWSKCRNVARSHRLNDVLRGSTRELYTDSTASEGTDGSTTSFTSNGFIVDNATGSTYNTTGENYVSWVWKANGAGVSNTAGTISSTVSANTNSGFSIVTWTGNGSGTASVGHGLPTTPKFVIIKKRNKSEFWYVAHYNMQNNYNYAYHMFFNTSGLSGSNDPYYLGTQASSGSTLQLAAGTSNNGGNENGINYVAYCWVDIPGYSSFGSYSGNSSADGPFIYTGFKPRWIMIRSTSGAREWNCWDTARGPYNIFNGGQLDLGNLHAEYTGSGYNDVVDVLSNGFKLRSAVSPNYNQGETYIYAAFAEHPFKTSRAR